METEVSYRKDGTKKRMIFYYDNDKIEKTIDYHTDGRNKLREEFFSPNGEKQKSIRYLYYKKAGVPIVTHFVYNGKGEFLQQINYRMDGSKMLMILFKGGFRHVEFSHYSNNMIRRQTWYIDESETKWREQIYAPTGFMRRERLYDIGDISSYHDSYYSTTGVKQKMRYYHKGALTTESFHGPCEKVEKTIFYDKDGNVKHVENWKEEKK